MSRKGEGAPLTVSVLVCILANIVCLYYFSSSECGQLDFLESTSGILVRENINASNHLYPYMATIISMSCLIVCVVFICQKGGSVQ